MKRNKNADPKKNKNAVLRKSKSAQNYGSLSQNEGNHEITTQLPRPELDRDSDSAIGSGASSVTCMSFEDDLFPTGNDELLSDLDNLILKPHSEQSQQLSFPRVQSCSVFSSPTARITSGQPAFVVPKVPIAPSCRAVRIGYNTAQKWKFQHNRIQPVDKVPENNAFQKQRLNSNNQETTDTGMDGEPSLPVTPNLDSNFTLELPLSASSLSGCSRGGMSDFVILHTDADIEEACAYMTHLRRDTGIHDLTVDLLSNIDAGKPGMQSLYTLHEKYRYILTYVTNNLKSDRYCQFLHEILLTFGLQEANGKEDRIVPVFTKKERCRIPAISVIRGLLYFNFHPLNNITSGIYIRSVRRLVQEGRAKFL